MASHLPTTPIPGDYSERIRRLRGRLGLTQQSLADQLGVSFATVNRWENGQTKPTRLYWAQLQKLAGEPEAADSEAPREPERELPLDFTASPEAVLAVAEGERLSYGHMANPTFATEISKIDPLPHQRIAVYDYMLKQERLRFLLADDAGAGKTIMTGLYIREMLNRRLLKRVLIVAPAGLVGNWKRELEKLFNLCFRIIKGADARAGNPFIGEASDRVIVSVDTLAGPVFSRLTEAAVVPYDLVVFDEAHKLSANREADLHVRRTDRYKLAEALAGVKDIDSHWKLHWSAHHLLLLTATPHMGKDYPYYALWRLLEPAVLSTVDAFSDYPSELRRHRFIRRTKEEMVYLDGQPLYPVRISDTLGYDLNQGETSEQRLYDETTEYLRIVYNKAKLLNRSAARLAMSVFQRRLASSTYALLCSFERRIQKLSDLIEQIRDGQLTIEQLITFQRRMREDEDVLDAKTADDEAAEDSREENETAEERLLQGVVAASVNDILAEREQVIGLRDLARKVYDAGRESKFTRLQEVIEDPQYSNQKLIIFTEHRDTLHFLVRRLGGLGFTGQIGQIHGGMDYVEREEQVERFRTPVAEGGAQFLVCTDAAGEGINLQFCWIMINYDVPWNPARLEQRMGRIHRYGQKHDPVIILNLVAPKTREGRVLCTLLDKLERIRKELRSDKVFDVIGRIFEGVSIKQYMEMAVSDDRADEVARELEGRLTAEQVTALVERERKLYASGGDVAEELPRLRDEMDRETYTRLLPGYVRHYFEKAAPLAGIEIEGDPAECFSLRPTKRWAVDALLQVLETYPDEQRRCLSFVRPVNHTAAVWIHPGEPIFEAFRGLVGERVGRQARRGAVFVDPAAEKPYLFHLAVVSVARDADLELADLNQDEVLDCRLVGVKQFEGADLQVCPIEHLLLLKGGHGLPASAQRLAVTAKGLVEQARAFLVERIARETAVQRRQSLLSTLAERESFVRRGFDYQEAELAAARAKQSEKARAGNSVAQKELARIKEQQKQLAQRRQQSLAVLRREPELIAPRSVEFIAHALVVPSSDPVDREQYDKKTEEVAMALAWAYEESCEATVQDVHTPDLALAAGLTENPGFDLLSTRRRGDKRSIEVKGRAGTGDVEVSSNEWARACNLREAYWLYVVYDCATPNPRLVRVQDPFGNLLAKAKGSVLIEPKQILAASKTD